MKKQKAIVNCENVKLYCLPKWYINCIIQSNKRRRKVKDSNQNIAKAVLKIRQDNKLSQEQFAEMVGVTRQAVSRWEMGVSVPNINTLILISEKFDIPVDEMQALPLLIKYFRKKKVQDLSLIHISAPTRP